MDQPESAGEGANNSVAVSETASNGTRSMHVGGKVMASTLRYDMRLQRMMGHHPVILHPNPRTALVVGFGAGVTAGSLVVHPEIERIVICEIEPLVRKTAAKYFGPANHNVLDEPSVKSELASFLQVFPEGTVWSSHIPRNGGTDLVMIGQVGAMKIDVDRLASRIERNPRLAQSLADVDLGYMVTLLATYFGRKPDLEQWLEGAQINHERSLRLQYLAGFSVERYEELEIYRSMAAYRRYPEDLFIAPPGIRERVQARWSQ